MRTLKKLELDDYDTFVKEQLTSQTKSIQVLIKKNQLSLFKEPAVREKFTTQQKLSSLNYDCSLFSRLYVAWQIQDDDMDEFLEHENQARPPTLSHLGKLTLGTKSELLDCLEDLVASDDNVDRPAGEVIILDCAAVMKKLRSGASKNFTEFASQIFLPYLASQLQQATRVDVVWDVCMPNVLEADTRNQRGERHTKTCGANESNSWKLERIPESRRKQDRTIFLFSQPCNSAGNCMSDHLSAHIINMFSLNNPEMSLV